MIPRYSQYPNYGIVSNFLLMSIVDSQKTLALIRFYI